MCTVSIQCVHLHIGSYLGGVFFFFAYTYIFGLSCLCVCVSVCVCLLFYSSDPECLDILKAGRKRTVCPKWKLLKTDLLELKTIGVLLNDRARQEVSGRRGTEIRFTQCNYVEKNCYFHWEALS